MVPKSLVFIFISLHLLFSFPIDRVTAENIARKWLNEKSGSENYDLVSEYIDYKSALHIFNFKNGGFAIVASDDVSKLILGYSFRSTFRNDSNKTNVAFWTELYKVQIEKMKTKCKRNSSRADDSLNLNTSSINNNSLNKDKEVVPLLSSIWNQSPIYNMYCPLDEGELSVTGCVATAIAQLLNYHKHPETGRGYASYSSLGQTLNVDYSLSRYKWTLMTDELHSDSPETAKHEIAQISYHAGVSVETIYSSTNSGSVIEKIPSAMRTYFKYSPGLSVQYRSEYSDSLWKDLISDQLNSGLPVIYSGSSSTAHAFICDGYQDKDYFHFNWGWGGYADGYFLIDNLNPAGNDFNSFQNAVVNIFPVEQDIFITDSIPDIKTADEIYQIKLSNYFISKSGDKITYSVDPSSIIDGLSFNITGDILYLRKIEGGVSNLVIKSETAADNSFDEFIVTFTKDMVLNGNIFDIITYDDIYSIDLKQYFSCYSGEEILYLVDPLSLINNLNYEINGGILTLHKIEEGISRIVISGSTSIDTIYDDFNFEFAVKPLLSGFGNSFFFNSSAYLDVGNSVCLNSMQNLSFSTFVKFNSVDENQGIASKSSSYGTGWHLILQSNNLLRFSIQTQDGLARRIYSNQEIIVDKWYHVDVVYNGKDLYMYINGKLDNFKDTYTSASPAISDTVANMKLGFADGLFLNGELDEVILWNDAIFIDKVRQVMREKPDITDSGLVSYWTFDSCQSSTELDETGSNNGVYINKDLGYFLDSSAPVNFFTANDTPIISNLLGETDTSSFFTIITTPTIGYIRLEEPATGKFVYTPKSFSSYIDLIKYTITNSKSVTPEKTILINVEDPSFIGDLQMPEQIALEQNYPNPFNPLTMITFSLDKASAVSLGVFNINGQKVAELTKGTLSAGLHTVEFNGSELNSGVYYYTLEVDGLKMTKKMVLTK